MKPNLLNFNQLHLLVVGDVMLDRYVHGDTSRVSPEAPVVIVRISDRASDISERPGGAGNVALNIAEIGAKVTLFGCCGEDESGYTLAKKLKLAGVEAYLEKHLEIQTIVKQRVLSLHQQLIRLDFEDQKPNYELGKLLDAYCDALPTAQAVIFSDYGKGMAKKAQEVIGAANTANIPIIVDPKGVDFTLYRGATLLTPNRKEFEAVVGVCRSEEEMHSKALKLIDELHLKALLVTRGEQGMTLFLPAKPPFHLPAHKHEVYDVTGAGDTVAAFLAMGIASQEDLPSAVALANVAAGIAVGKLGAATITMSELKCALFMNKEIFRGVITEEACIFARQEAKMQGERVVMTNGCFDILHAGHVAYLEEAKALGHRLIVAVNNDASVARLKGADRPINSLESRMAVLAGLSAVDWVVPFSEDTPERLITQLLPDVLVKGGDYEVDEIAGAKSVLENGGDVKILQFVEGYSTTRLIHRVQEMLSWHKQWIRAEDSIQEGEIA